LDEPLASLDVPVRRGLRREVKSIQQELGVPTIYVTHDPHEALTLGDRIAVIGRGRVEQIGSPAEVCQRPANSFVSELFDMQDLRDIQRLKPESQS
jgi:ABC-type sugar transport system ATPase subunit